jgi:hypothetical protein
MRVPALLLATTVAVSQSIPANVKTDADKFQQKLQQIVANGNSEGRNERRTPVSQTETNAYLRVRGPELLPVGVTDATLAAHGAGRVSGRAVVDLDVIRQKKSSGSWLDLKSYLTGTLPVTASGILHTKDGMARFELESAEVSGIPVPKAFLQDLVAYYTRSRDYPNGISLDQVYELPANIREIQIGQGNAIVVQ